MFVCVFVDVHCKINLVRGYSSTLFRCPCALFHCVIMFVCLFGGVHRKIIFVTGYSSTVFRVSVRAVSLCSLFCLWTFTVKYFLSRGIQAPCLGCPCALFHCVALSALGCPSKVILAAGVFTHAV